MGLFDDYPRLPGFCEVFEGDGARHHYGPLVDELSGLGTEALAERARTTEATFRRLGITFGVHGDSEGTERTWPIDLIPRIITAAEWDVIERGLIQRIRALNLFLDDLYAGEAAAVNDGVVPRWLVASSQGFHREAMGISVPNQARCVVAGIDIVRDADGTFRVLEDNLRVPSGVSYVLENRLAMQRAFPSLFERYPVRPVADYGTVLLESLRSLAPSGVDDPTVVVLTPGVFNSAYFEHAFLARRMGVELVEGRDLIVKDHAVYMRTTRGLQPVHVIYRRIDDEFLDPVFFDRTSLLGVPGLLSAVRAGRVTVSNAFGNGVADDKAVYAFVPDLVRYYLAQEPILPNAETYLLWDPEQRSKVLERLDEVVVKPVSEAGGLGIIIGPHATDEQLERARRAILTHPRAYIAQEVVNLSTHPTFIDGTLRPRHLDLRPFVVTGERITVLPGGLTRVALREGSLIVNSSQGGGSKDTWVLAGEAAS